MKRMNRVALVVVLATLTSVAVGCSSTNPGLQERFQNVNTNNSWPERYSYQARESVLHPFEVQANNAAVVDGVINVGYFEDGTANLNGVGRTKIDQLARKMPFPNPNLYLQTASDIAVDLSNPQSMVEARTKLDNDRAQAILSYINSRPNTRGVAFNVNVVDISDPTVNSEGPARAVRGLPLQYNSTLLGAIGGQLIGTGGGQAVNTIGVQPGAPVAPTPAPAPR